MERFIKLEEVNGNVVFIDRTKILWIEAMNVKEEENSKIVFDGGSWITVKGSPNKLLFYDIGSHF